MSEYKFKRGSAEMVAARAKIPNNTRPLFVFALYIQPKAKAKEVKETMDLLADSILKIKNEIKNPYIVIGGDLNKFSLSPVIDNFADIHMLDTPPTRGASCLDVVASSIPADDCIADCFPPLSSENDVSSDHRVLVIKSDVTHKHEFTWIRYRTRQITDEGIAALKSEITNYQWLDLATNTDCPSLSLIHI